MDTASTSTGSSLLPYVNALTEGIYIKFRHPAPGDAKPRTAIPARSNPISHLRCASIIAQGRQDILDVTCVCQPDLPSIESSALNPLTNQDIENIWQETWAQLGKEGGASNPFVLPCQIGEKGDLVQLKPLLYCAHKKRYGHPLCPTCASALELCDDDDLLTTAGLSAHSGSLNRYLYCESCHRKEDGSPFYVRRLMASSPANVQDCDALMVAFSRLLGKSDLSDDLPCIGCDEADNCYGVETLVLKRMQPFQFYPFHMFIQKAATLNAVEFIMLLSGADPIELELLPTQNRLKNELTRIPRGGGYLFGQDDRLFLEILYLKLTFLQELFTLVRHQALFFTDRISLEGIGVQINLPGSKLPCFWNYELKLVDPIGGPSSYPPGSILPDMAAKEFLGLVWCYVLLVNDHQPFARVMGTIRQCIEAVIENPADAGHLLGRPVFNPGNIFWYPKSFEPPSHWLEFWIETLASGCELLGPGQGYIAEVSLSASSRKLEHLRRRVHGALFSSAADFHSMEEENHDGLDARIASLLEKILEKWSRTRFPSPGDTSALDRSALLNTVIQKKAYENGDLEEITIHSKDQVSIPDESCSEEPVNDLQETVVIQSCRDRLSLDDAADDPEETVITSSSGTPQAEEELDVTIVMRQSQEPKPEDQDDELEKTVLVSTPDCPEGHPEPEQAKTKGVLLAKRIENLHEDHLDETVVLRPDKDPQGKRKT